MAARTTTLSVPLGLTGRMRRGVVRALPEPLVRGIRVLRGHRPPRVVTLDELDSQLEEAATLFAVSELCENKCFQYCSHSRRLPKRLNGANVQQSAK